MINEEELKRIICNGVHGEDPEIEWTTNYVSIRTEIWSPDIYYLDPLLEEGLAYVGELNGAYIFRLEH